MKYQVIIEIYVVGKCPETEWIVGGVFYRKELAELFVQAYEAAGYEAIIVDLEKKD